MWQKLTELKSRQTDIPAAVSALSDVMFLYKEMRRVARISVGWPEFVRFKHFVEEHAGVHEILARYS